MGYCSHILDYLEVEMAILIIIIVLAGAFFLTLGYLIDFRFDFRRRPSTSVLKKREYIRGCEPFEMGEGDNVLMVLHGIGGSPAQLKHLCRALSEDGCHIFATLLPGHGTSPDDLYDITWEQWYAHVEAEFRRLQEQYKNVSIMGFSLGASLAMRLAANYEVKNLVLISSPCYGYLFHDWLPAHWLLRFASRLGSTARTFPQELPQTEDMPRHLIYKGLPMDALNATVDLAKDLKPSLENIGAPTLFLHSRRDPASRAKGVEYNFEHIGSEQKRMVWFERAPHGIMHGSMDDRAILRQEIASFLSK